jgi:hypothetical protein
MCKDHQQILAKGTNSIDRAESIGIWPEASVDEDGRDSTSHLDHKEGESCIEFLNHVSLGSHLVLPNLSRLSGPFEARAQRHREADALSHVVDIGRNPWTTT